MEAAWAAAQRGAIVTLYEMRPERTTPVHHTGFLAELVCSNSFKSNLLTNASGTLKEEMRRLGSLIIPVAERHRVPAGEALAVDPLQFSTEVTAAIEGHPSIRLVRKEVTALPNERPLIIATGPLTSDSLAAAIAGITGSESLSFYDAVAPTVTLESLNMDRLFRASRRGKGMNSANPLTGESSEVTAESNADYLNAPLTKEEYEAFWQELCGAETAPLHEFEEDGSIAKPVFFEMCLPIEELARRGQRTLSFGAMKPIGLIDPRTGKRPWAVVQLRQENREGAIWGLVGFQTRLKWGEQKRIFRMIPGLENAEFVRYGVIHRNTYINSPILLDRCCRFKADKGIFFAGQITGVEGYLESAAIGIVAGINAARQAEGKPCVELPSVSVLGSLCHYLTDTEPRHFAPMNSNWGIAPELEDPLIRDKKTKAEQKSARALAAIDRFVFESTV